MYKVVAGWWCCVWSHKQRQQVWGQQFKSELLWIGYGCTTGNGYQGQWGEVVGWCIQGGGGGVVLHLVAQAGVADLGPKGQN